MELQRDNLLVVAGREEALGGLAPRFAEWAGAEGAQAPRLAVVSEDPRVLIAAAIGLYASRADGAIVAAATATPHARALLAGCGYSLLEISPGGVSTTLTKSAAAAARREGRIAILTSGTTGTPTLHLHTWDSLVTLRSAGGAATLQPRRWLLTYLPGTYAWFQMLTLWMFHPRQTLVASSHSAPEEVWDDGARAGVDAVSSTPSFWRYLLALRPAGELARLPLAQITLGGEPVRQDLLDRLAAFFPAARLTHIYASTEAGAAIVVHDGREGFPAEWLDGEEHGACRLRAVDGILEVRSPFAAAGTGGAGGWHVTGDRVEIAGGRAVVVGRAERDLLNVGGRKASAAAIEQLLAASPLVDWCRVRGARAPLAGTLVAADVVLSASAHALTAAEAERALTAHCAARGLPDWMVPRLWTLLERVPVSPTFKVERADG